MAEASQSCSIVVFDEVEDEGVSLAVVDEAVFACVLAGDGMVAEGLGQPSVEALGHAVGLGPVGLGELVFDALCLADLVEGMLAGPFVALAPAGVAEAVCELRSIVGEHGVDRVTEGREEALQAGCDGLAAALIDDLDMDEAGDALDGHEDIGRAPFEAGQMLEVDVHIAERLGIEALDRRRRLGGPLRHAPALQAAMQGRAGDLGAQAAAHDLQHIVQRQAKLRAQLHRDLFLFGREAGGQAVRNRRTVGDVLAPLPAPHRGFAKTQLTGQLGDRPAGSLDIGPHPRRRRGVGVQLQEHRRSSSQAMPNPTPSLSIQPSGTKHEGREERNWGQIAECRFSLDLRPKEKALPRCGSALSCPPTGDIVAIGRRAIKTCARYAARGPVRQSA